MKRLRQIYDTAQQRKKKGKLSTWIVTARTRARYIKCVNDFIKFVVAWKGRLPAEMVDWDEALCLYVENLYDEGLPKATAQYTAAGLQYFKPSFKHNLGRTWQLLKAWAKAEIPDRAWPFSLMLVQNMIVHQLANSEPLMAVGLWLGFHAFLRTAELCLLRWEDVSFTANNERGVILLRDTKSGQRIAHMEGVTLDDPLLCRLMVALCPVPSKGLIVGLTSGQFRGRFQHIVDLRRLNGLSLRPYSLRRGGATYMFRETGVLSRIMVRGRWASEKSCRLYVMEGVGQLANLRLDQQQRSVFEAQSEKFSVLVKAVIPQLKKW